MKLNDDLINHSGMWQMYDVAEASTLWTHVACKKSGNCYSKMDAYVVNFNLSYRINGRISCP